MYASNATYSEQLRALEQYVKANPKSAEARFVLAYHYLTCGHTEPAQKQYQEVLKLQPNDQLSAQLLSLVGGDGAANQAATPPEAEPTDPAEPTPPAEIDATKIVGKWKASRKDGAKFHVEPFR